MASVQYFVTRHKGQWMVALNCEYSGPYATEEEAIRVAVDAAHKEGKVGRDAQVLVQGHDHRFRHEWTYGQDPYPPSG
ncbi:LDH2 family malate/lactate/ureidoglycolate dehydrogenase [Bradyrhizobium diazoefficiens]|jgi:LDH2 family malate/lactate/ureidoglycolate dehydrogenase|uniref:DUF2188 domain-containing protein n=6 Tax=Nitrobacteraceae TaxID=41294 RepID=A0A7Z0QBI0_9BRAD|nr:hypothetical protein AAV28_06415 [Bradyrhizobium diazoefficiens USDA 110]APG14841.1 hypothetical protein BKD09_41505 [Bradyrhizobium japonicum]APO50542.1 hypothetical protein BD122_09840 [Bradyrhizobium diazoefficiens]AWL91421.1 DUF2188 domain-containing protein [Bradyrhizobium ottawaense]MBR0883672.1 DUF2188 domain-containing protein [Bradyrhizobium liaoningense]MCS3899338.1 LDH2 family malate/lactate/ureidoglycolate dehydrogenase [Bradyrhizobium japonicum USDA 38]TWH92050.1 uncharacteriz